MDYLIKFPKEKAFETIMKSEGGSQIMIIERDICREKQTYWRSAWKI